MEHHQIASDLRNRLQHKPVVLLPYEAHDGIYLGATDCKHLSVGWAQYDGNKLSAKALRQKNGRWSGQSEELPVHRAIDLTTLIAHTLGASASRNPVNLPAGTLENQGQRLTVPLCYEDADESERFDARMQDALVKRRLSRLLETLERLRLGGVI